MIANSRSQWISLPGGFLLTLWRDDAIRVSTAVFIALRIITAVAAFIMLHNQPMAKPNMLWYDPRTGAGNPSGPVYDTSLPLDSPFYDELAPWRRYDTLWYIKTAITGYKADLGIVFPPLYPILISMTVPFTAGNYVLASLVVSNVFCWLAFLLLYKLIQREFHDNALATRTLICLAAFPTAFYLMAGYTEPLFLALSIGAFLAAFDKKWFIAGLLACLASLTRLQGIVLCVPLAWIAYWDLRERGLRAILARVPAVIGAGIGSLIYEGAIILNNDGSMERAYNIGWKLTTRMPWVSIGTFINRIQTRIVQDYENNNAMILLVMIALTLVLLWKYRHVYAIYAGATIFVIMLRYHYGLLLEGAQFESAFRYVLVLFPCFIVMGRLLKRKWLLVLYVIVCLQWQLYLLDNFVHWRWVA